MAGGIDWFRWHHGTVTDPRLRVIAKRAGARLGEVIAVWVCLLEFGGENGASLAGFDAAACDAILDLQAGQTSLIYRELEIRGFVADGRIANPRRYYPAPCMRPSGGAWAVIRARVFKRDNYTCQYCGARGGRLECDHMVPVADGGQHVATNLVTACFGCNRSKASLSLAEWEASRGW